MKPIQFDPTKTTIEKFSEKYKIHRVVDRFEAMLEELFLIRNPKFRFRKPDPAELYRFVSLLLDGVPMLECGSWYYFPWSSTLVHYLPDALHQELHTARNRNLITAKEQKAFREFKVGIAGLSVGSHTALTLAMMGGARTMRIADSDYISGSNLNRIRLDFSYVGTGKCEAVAGLIYQTNPYANVELHPKGLSRDTIESFMTGLDVFVECMDDLDLKIRSRLVARKLGIPVLMATDNGDGILLDVERYDLNPETELFNGAVGSLTLEEFQGYTPEDLPRLATRLVGTKFVPPRMLRSVAAIGTELYAWPQVGSAATLTGVVVAHAIKRLANRLPLKGGRTALDLDALLDPDFDQPEAREERERQSAQALNGIGFATE